MDQSGCDGRSGSPIWAARRSPDRRPTTPSSSPRPTEKWAKVIRAALLRSVYATNGHSTSTWRFLIAAQPYCARRTAAQVAAFGRLMVSQGSSRSAASQYIDCDPSRLILA